MKSLKNNKLFILILITLISNILGLIREILIAYKFGTSESADMIITSQIIPVMLVGYTFFTFTNAYIPFFQSNRKKYSESVLNSTAFIFIIPLTLVVIIIILLFLNGIYELFFGIEESNSLLVMTKILLLVSLFMSLTSIPMGYLQIKEKYYIVNFSNMIVVNLLTIIFIWITNNQKGLAYGYVLGSFFAMLIIYFSAIRNGFRINGKFKNNNKVLIKDYSNIAISIISISLINQIFSVIDRSLASHYAEGTVTSIYLSNRLVGLCIMILILPLTTISFPKIILYINTNEQIKARRISTNIIYLTILITTSITSFIFIFSDEIIRFLFDRGNFNSKSVSATSDYLKGYILFLFAWCLREIYSKLLIAYNLHKYLIVNTILLVFLNLIFSGILSILFGPIGIPIGSGISIIITIILIYMKLNFKIEFIELLMIAIFNIINIMIYYFINFYLPGLTGFVIGIIIFLTIYIVMYYMDYFKLKTMIKELNE